ncbi:alpha/beta hydrolase [Aspergillus homomorphus CBS 101889]|uniref:Alpha/beta-hydrolase n=1 Tax=Aspergillus homomorphus (strain CBS 101889) TaxID=1450537 RepID=A0A395I611_ASPHC|nr:alpha/beta-hydrolase [Aspergillus homomorphus CBS 101889]RAL15189.1 alpha/beta-hydrolase [Aspergillus homomorphus CBS 101889]
MAPPEMPSGYEMKTLPYKTTGSLSLNLDIIYPLQASTTPVPVLIHYHGGFLIVGDRQSFLPHWLVNACAARGWIFVTPDYRLLPETTAHDAVADAVDAYQWVRTSLASTLQHLSPGPVIAAGASAGAYLALTSASQAEHKPDALLLLYGMLDPLHEHFTHPVDNFFGMTPSDSRPFFDAWAAGQQKDDPAATVRTGYPIPADPSTDARMGLIAALHGQALLPDYMAGVPGLAGRVRDGSGGEVVDLVPEKARGLFAIACGRVAGLPPTAVVHGRNDVGVPVTISLSATETLRRLGVQVHAEFPDDAPHGFDAMLGDVDIERSRKAEGDTPALESLRRVLGWLDALVGRV